MSSNESSGASAEATATTPASTAAATFGSTRGSGLARGKRPANSPATTAATPASTEYTPTAIEVVSAPREYQNPFAPAETPVAAHPEPMVSQTPASAPAVVDLSAVASAKVEAPASTEPAELNILEPEQQKTAPAQTWESEGFRPAREPRHDRPRREESRRDEPRHEERTERAPQQESTPFDPASIPEKFLYVRPGYNYVPTPSNYGGAPRENREPRPASTESYSAPAASAPAKSGGFLGWLKSLFGGSSPETVAPAASNGEHRRDGGQRRHRGGRNRGGHGGGDRAGYQGGGEGGQRRSRGGRGRSGGGFRGERSEGARGGDSTG